MNSFSAAIRKETLEQWRTYRFLVVAAVLVIFGLLSPLVAQLSPEMFRLIPGGEQIAGLIPKPTVQDAIAQYVKNTSQFAIILAILLTMGSVAQEKEKGTAAMMLVKPLPRWAFLLAKFIASLVVFTCSVLLAALGAYYYTMLLFEPMPIGGWLALNGLLLAYTLVYVALTLFFSTLSRSQALAGGLSLATLGLLGLLGAIPRVGEILPGQIITWGALLMSQTGKAYWPALWVSLGIILAALVGGWLVLRKQEL